MYFYATRVGAGVPALRANVNRLYLRNAQTLNWATHEGREKLDFIEGKLKESAMAREKTLCKNKTFQGASCL